MLLWLIVGIAVVLLLIGWLGRSRGTGKASGDMGQDIKTNRRKSEGRGSEFM